MQTFLPYPDFKMTMQVLDWRRLGKQRIEAYQILNILLYQKYGTWLKPPKTTKIGWINHPAVKMWYGFENALTSYMNHAIIEWQQRGYKNTMKIYEVNNIILPPWIGDESFHASHRSNLLRKNYAFYSKFNWNENENMPYIWPI